MAFVPYRRVLAVPAVRQALLVGLLIRVPLWAATVILTLHVVSTLQLSYSAAGALAAASTIALAVSGPWRGRLLDRLGLRRTVLPCLMVGVVCWSIAPWVGYLPLLVLVVVAGLFVVPTFSIMRQWLIASTPAADRKTVLVLDSVATEMSFMVGPAVGVVAAVTFDTRITLMVAQLLSLAGGLVLFVLNPPMRHADESAEEVAPKLRVRQWVTPVVLAVLLASAASTTVLSSGDVGVVAAMREMGLEPQIGIVLGIWGFGSAIGGLVYGGMRRSIGVFWLLLGLGLVTLPIAFARDPISFTVLVFISGLLCAPTIAATVDHLSRVVPARVRGEAMGWHGSAMTAGSAVGAPLAGIAIDNVGWPGAFVANAAVGMVLAVLGLVAVGVWGRRTGAAGIDPQDPAPAEG